MNTHTHMARFEQTWYHSPYMYKDMVEKNSIQNITETLNRWMLGIRTDNTLLDHPLKQLCLVYECMAVRNHCTKFGCISGVWVEKDTKWQYGPVISIRDVTNWGVYSCWFRLNKAVSGARHNNRHRGLTLGRYRNTTQQMTRKRHQAVGGKINSTTKG